MRDGVRLINCAPRLVDEDAHDVEVRQVAGAAFDVFVEEPATSNKLFELPNFIATPHLGASTTGAGTWRCR